MSALWPQLLRPFWLLIVPLLIWLLWRLWHRQRQVGRWQRLLPEAFHATLLTSGRASNSRLPIVALGAAWLLASLALLGPSWQYLEQPSLKRADPLVVLLELTPEMLAGDLAPSRFEQARRKLLDLLQTRQDAQTAVVVFAGSAHTLVPLSNDQATTQNLLDALHPRLMPEAGHRADLAVAQGLALLDQGAWGRGRLLLIGSSLDPTEQAAIGKLLGRHGERLSILGVGTAQGAPIAQEDGSFLKDAQGAIIIPRLDSGALQHFANRLGGRYQQVRLDDSDLDALGLLAPSGARLQESETTRLDAWLDQGYWLLLPLLLLAACAGRRGWLFCLPLLLALPQPASALTFADLWLRADQQGQRLLETQRPAEAAERFENRQWQGVARYQAGDYQGAAERFAEGATAADHYNRGNALARSEALEAAIEAYEQALALQPDLSEAAHNKALVEELLRQRQAQSAPQPQSQQAQQPSAQGAPPQPSHATTTSAEPQQTRALDGAAEEDAEQRAATQAQPVEETPVGDLPATEEHQATEQWLRKIPDDPGELLRRKFLFEQRKRQEAS